MSTSIKNDELLYDIYDLRNELKQNFSDLIINFNINRTDEKSRLYNDEDEKDEDEFNVSAYVTFKIFIPLDEKYTYKLIFIINGFSGVRHFKSNKDLSKFLLDFLITSKVFRYVKYDHLGYSDISKLYDINFKKLYSENIINEYKLYTLENSI